VRAKQVASEAQGFTADISKGSDLLILDVTARPGVDGEQLEEKTVEEVEALRAGIVTDMELSRALSLIETEFENDLQAAEERADRLSMFATYFGDPSLLNAQVARYRDVTLSDVNAFAHERLGESNRASLIYVPRERGATPEYVAHGAGAVES
jgi:predicted Zn-dependent peptidase